MSMRVQQCVRFTRYARSLRSLALNYGVCYIHRCVQYRSVQVDIQYCLHNGDN